ncbi:NosD domain-containing protein [Bacillus spongiae]|uniref:NosD domain-containing protein n=1 Tax=Bacillus spongiae TaxID=2683610 RepID=A0ABU8HJ80_9BACI
MTIFIVPDDFPTVQAVIDNVVPPILVSGDSIEVRAGTFPSFVLPDEDQNGDPLERVRIAGCGIGKTIFFGGASDGVVIDGSPQTYLKDFTVQNYSGSGVLLQIGPNLSGDNCVIQDIEATFNGIGFDIQTNDNTLVNNFATFNVEVGGGFAIMGEDNCLFENSSNENRRGYYVTGTNNQLVDNIGKQNAQDGFLLITGGSNTLVGNLAQKNNIGINCQTDNNLIKENRSCNNINHGIILVGDVGSEPNGNRVDGNIARGNGSPLGVLIDSGIFVIDGAGTVNPNAITFNKLKLNEDFSILDEAGLATPNIYNGNVCTDNPSSPPEACDPGIN